MPREHGRRIPLAPDEPPSPPDSASPSDPPTQAVSRRAALQGLAASLGVVFAAPSMGDAEPHPVGLHVAQRATSKPARTPRAAAPQFLDQHQFATLAIVADLIVPGAVASGSHTYIDEVLAIERPAIQQRFLGALGALDAAARDRYQQPLKSLARDRQIAVLEAAATESRADASPAPEAPPDPERAKPTGSRTSLQDPLGHLKTWIAGAHYSSEAGMKELGWTGGMFFSAFPGCTHPDGHQ